MVLVCASMFGQELSRDRSRYAVNNFVDDDKYTATAPYEVNPISQPKSNKVKNVIFMIGDGMGLEQVSAAWVANGGKLNIDNCPVTGIQRTYAANKLVTDSAAAGSALATGQKSDYKHIAADHDGNPVSSLRDVAQACGKKTGIIVTCRINDATPAVFMAHNTSRDNQEEIVADIVESNVDFITGGGIKYWTSRTDGIDMVQKLQDKGYTFVDNNEDLVAVDKLPVLGLFAPTEMEPALERDNYLEKATMKAIELLDNKKGFFMMVEGSCIDDYGHDNKAGYVMEELYDFDRTLGKVLEWAAKDGHTLVVVTGDHSTGGMTLLGGSLEEKSIEVNFSTTGHNGVYMPVYVYGPHAADFTGIYENSDLSNKIRALIK